MSNEMATLLTEVSALRAEVERMNHPSRSCSQSLTSDGARGGSAAH